MWLSKSPACSMENFPVVLSSHRPELPTNLIHPSPESSGPPSPKALERLGCLELPGSLSLSTQLSTPAVGFHVLLAP